MSTRTSATSIIALVIGSFAVVMSATTMNVAIDPMMTEFLVSHNVAQSFSSVFLGMTVVCAPLASWLADRFGAWRVFSYLLVLYFIVSLLAGFSATLTPMLVARGIQGLCAGVIQPLSLFLVLETANPSRQGRTLSMFSLGVVMAPALGPTLAGYVVEHADWRQVFWLGIPPALVALGLIAWCRPPERVVTTASSQLDLSGLGFLAVLVMLVFIWPLILDRFPWLALLLGLVWLMLIWLFWRQLKSRDGPLINPALLRHQAYFSGLLVMLAYGIGMYGSIFLIPLLLQSGLGESAVTTGNLLLLGGITLAVSIPVSGRLVDRFSSQLVVMIGLSSFAVSSVLLAWPGGLISVAVGIVISRFALGMIIPGLYTSMAQAVPDDLLRQGTAIATMTRQAGGAVGITLMGVLLSSLTQGWILPLPQTADLPYRVLFGLIAVLFLASLLAARRMGRTDHKQGEK